MAGIRSDCVQVHPYRLAGQYPLFLILRRSDQVEFHPGVWQVVTGRINAGESSHDAAHRELLEETGFEAMQWIALPQVASFYFEPTDSVIFAPIFCCEIKKDADVRLSLEHTEAVWVNGDDARRILQFPSQRDVVQLIETLLSQHE